MFCLLLSSLFIYNSMGTIDENALQNINLILNLALKIRIKGGNEKASEDELIDAFPSFLWILRDAFLSQEDVKGRKLTSTEYLENSLKAQNGMTTTIFNKNKIRSKIKKFFPVRDCLRFVRPVEDESMLQKLNKVDNKFLRKEFKTQVKNARKHIFNKMKAKTYNGQNLRPKLILELAKSYLEAINEHKELNIESSWKYVVRTQANKAKIYVIELVGRLVVKINQELGGNNNIRDDSKEEIILNEWAKGAVYGISWEVWKDQLKRDLLSIFRKKCVSNSTEQNFLEIEKEICDNVEERLQKMEMSIVSTVRNRVKKKIRKNIDPLGVGAIEGELSVNECKMKLKEILVNYVEEEMKEILLKRIFQRVEKRNIETL